MTNIQVRSVAKTGYHDSGTGATVAAPALHDNGTGAAVTEMATMTIVHVLQLIQTRYHDKDTSA
jgi:hypothetical protein